MDELMKKGIFGTGTLMKNRMPKEAHLTDDKDLLKKSRGTSVQRLRPDSTLACTKWVDKKPIVMLSAAFGVEPEDNEESEDDFSSLGLISESDSDEDRPGSSASTHSCVTEKAKFMFKK
ncbi:hypothetical protein HPB52_012259 [Rhipicephalus sanguineus]|uniref:Uncharacterized protein n=1 Tax=Rhipicephalus sanguineus TaxID=34632 RepID=A0A9D4PMJ9_RHISA|nr:hypothetical protein HPB52_012259 [Rhipicephalus sanguineus]